MQPVWPPEEKKVLLMNIICTFARVLGAARDKNHNSFPARGGKEVANHCLIPFIPFSLGKTKKQFSMFGLTF